VSDICLDFGNEFILVGIDDASFEVSSVVEYRFVTSPIDVASDVSSTLARVFIIVIEELVCAVNKNIENVFLEIDVENI
jgi:hypothetical protein